MLNKSKLEIGDIVTIKTIANLSNERIILGWVVDKPATYQFNIRGWSADFNLVEETYFWVSIIKIC